MTACKRCLLLFACLLAGMCTANASDLHQMPKNTPRPMPVGVALSILDIQDIRENLNTMYATVELRLTWQDPRLAFDPIKQGSNRLEYADQDALRFLDAHWTPRIVMTNQISVTGTPAIGVEVLPDGTVIEVRTVNAGFYIRSDYSDFPFDRQAFPIDIASDRYNRDQLTLQYGAEEAAASTIGRSAQLAQWTLTGLEADHSAPIGWDGTSFEHLGIKLKATRNTLQYAPQIFLPYLFIMLGPVILLVVRADEAVLQKATMLSGATLATIALQFSVGASFPDAVLTDNIVSRMFWLGYAFLVTMLLLVITVHNTTIHLFKDPYVLKELRTHLNWMPVVAFTVLTAGNILAPLLRHAYS